MTAIDMTRRRLVFGTALGVVSSPVAYASQTSRLPPTPGDVEGPFYPVDIPDDSDNDLLRIVGRDALAKGRATYLHGRVMDRDGQRIDRARVEIWQCDADGVYHHPGDPGTPDADFQGFGAMVTDREGAYHFRTLRPVPYDGRTPHIHFRVTADGFDRLTTQLYVAEEAERNRRDGLYRRHGPERQPLVTTRFEPVTGSDGLLTAAFDIVLG